MRYSRHLDYLRLLIRRLSSESRPQSPSRLADAVGLGPGEVEDLLVSYPTVFRASQSPRRRTGSSSEQRYALQIWPSHAEASSHEAERLLEFVERSAAAEQAQWRFRIGLAAAAGAVLAALLLTVVIVTWGGASAPISPPLQEQAQTGNSVGDTSGSGHSRWASNQNGGFSNEEAQTGGGSSLQAKEGGDGWSWASLAWAGSLIGLGFFLLWLQPRASTGETAKAGITLASAYSFVGGIAAWAQPALTIGGDASKFHNATAAALLSLLLLAILVLLVGFLARGHHFARFFIWGTLAAWMSILVALTQATISSRAAFRRDYLDVYLAADGPQRFNAGLYVMLALVGVALAFAAAHWMNRGRQKG
jgi:hypothetical protein